MARHINDIIVHCTATKEGQDFHRADIDQWHRNQGWDGVGYHYVVCLDGTIEVGRDIARQGAHCQGRNALSVGVVYVGGLDAQGRPNDTRTPAQRLALLNLLRVLVSIYHCPIHGHNEYAPKACPCFDVATEYASLYRGSRSVSS